MIRKTAWLTMALFGLLAPMLPMALGQGAGVSYTLVITCPLDGGGTTESFCPYRVVDGSDAMGDPSLAVDPFDTSNLILGSLHGSGNNQDEGAPSVKSRWPPPGGGDFTTFTSTDSGQSWADNPFEPPSEVDPQAWGETASVVVNPYGQVFVGSLYSRGEPIGSLNWSYVIAAQKFSSIAQIREYQGADGSREGDYHAQYLDPIYPDNQISQFWFLYNPRTDNMTMVWNEQLKGAIEPPCLDDTVLVTLPGYYVHANPGTTPPEVTLYQETNGVDGLQTEQTCPRNPDDQVFGTAAAAMLARPDVVQAIRNAPEQAAAAKVPRDLGIPQAAAHAVRTSRTTWEANSTTPPLDLGRPHSAIGIVWTTPAVNASYYYQDLGHTIMPCTTSTNPVLKEGYLYVGCVADPEQGTFIWNPDVIPGTIELFRINLDNGTRRHMAPPEYLGSAPIIGGSPRLGVRSDGRMALVSASAVDGRLNLQAAFGRYDSMEKAITWSEFASYGSILEKSNPEWKIVDAQVQDMIYREYSGALHLILKEIVQPVGLNAAALTDTINPHIRKFMIALDETYGVLAKHNLDVGNIQNRTSDPELYAAPEMVYNDLSDDFLQLPPDHHSYNGVSLGNEYSREFFAVGDYGQILFAEVIELTNLRGPAFAVPPALPPPIPAPALAPASTLVTALGLSISTMMAAAFVLQRQKHLQAIRQRLKKRRNS